MRTYLFLIFSILLFSNFYSQIFNASTIIYRGAENKICIEKEKHLEEISTDTLEIKYKNTVDNFKYYSIVYLGNKVILGLKLWDSEKKDSFEIIEMRIYLPENKIVYLIPKSKNRFGDSIDINTEWVNFFSMLPRNANYNETSTILDYDLIIPGVDTFSFAKREIYIDADFKKFLGSIKENKLIFDNFIVSNTHYKDTVRKPIVFFIKKESKKIQDSIGKTKVYEMNDFLDFPNHLIKTKIERTEFNSLKIYTNSMKFYATWLNRKNNTLVNYLDANGALELDLENIPKGKYEIRIWHKEEDKFANLYFDLR